MLLRDTMKFIEMNDLKTKIHQLSTEEHAIFCYKESAFLLINPIKPTELPLSIVYQVTEGNKGDLYQIALNKLMQNPTIMEKARNKTYQNQLHGSSREMLPTSIFKLHINLNNIFDLDEKIILGLIELLAKKTTTKDDNLSYHFKIIDPVCLAKSVHGKRFQNTDQLTIYFDGYNSIFDMFKLSEAIESYLIENGVKENELTLGPKDSFCLNSFVSARIAMHPLLSEYGQYSFYDKEIMKLIARYKENMAPFKAAPAFIIDMVFNTIFLDDTIQNFEAIAGGLSDEDSKKIQDRFDLIIAEPIHYLTHPHKLVNEEAPIEETVLNPSLPELATGNSETNSLSAYGQTMFTPQAPLMWNAAGCQLLKNRTEAQKRRAAMLQENSTPPTPSLPSANP